MHSAAAHKHFTASHTKDLLTPDSMHSVAAHMHFAATHTQELLTPNSYSHQTMALAHMHDTIAHQNQYETSLTHPHNLKTRVFYVITP